jgi:probable HAF family extracellular repeat protein
VVSGAKDLADVPLDGTRQFHFTTGPCDTLPPYAAVYEGFDAPQSANNTIFNGINNNGAIVGTYTTSDGVNHGLKFSNGTFTTVDFPGDRYTIAESINDNGDITGSHTNDQGGSAFRTHGFILHSGSFTSFDFNAGQGGTTISRGINNSGVTVGLWQSSDNTVIHGWMRQPDGSIAQFDMPGTFDSNAEDINNLGDVVGDPGDITKSYLYKNGTFTTFKPNGSEIQSRGMNDHDDVVGVLSCCEPGITGFLKKGNNYFKVNVPGSIETLPMDINADGVIVGWYVDANHKTRGFRATPIVP